jgi:hypothetical protein
MSGGKRVRITPPGVRRWTSPGNMNAMADDVVDTVRPAFEAILQMGSLPIDASRTVLDIGRGRASWSQLETVSLYPAFRMPSRKTLSPFGVS